MSQEKLRLYLVDMVTLPQNLQAIIDKEDIQACIIYAFCGSHAPKISLASLEKYSAWLHSKHLHIVQVPPHTGSVTTSGILNTEKGGHPIKDGDDSPAAAVSHLIAFWMGKLMSQYSPTTTKVFVASQDTTLYPIILSLRQDGYEVESSWPDLESVECTDDILYSVLKVIQSVGSPPDSIDHFAKFLRQECHLPEYISLKSMIKQMMRKGFISVHKGAVDYHLPVFVEGARGAPSEPLPNGKGVQAPL
jgi:hypothetical protein